jgi:membrane protease subunit HflK
MTEQAPPIDRRAQSRALLGVFLQLAAFVLLALLGAMYGSSALAAAARFAIVGLPIWFVLWLVFKQIGRVMAESLETDELKRAQAAGMTTAIFEVDDESLLIEQHKLKGLVKWLLPGASLLLSCYLIIGQFVGWSWSFQDAFSATAFSGEEQPIWLAFVCGFLAFASFLYARYSLSLARLPEWRLLHAGANVMAGNALVFLVLALGLAGATQVDWAEPLAAYVVRVLLLVLGIEFAINYVLDLYRPRRLGEVPRPSFDSRILSLVTEPGGVAKTIADAINYQFGFEVSKTWFYLLLQRWMLPLLAVTVLIILLLSSVVVVDAGQHAMVERWGKVLVDSETEQPRIYTPGLYLKMPYPVDRVYRARVDEISELQIGDVQEPDDADAEGEDVSKKAIVWSETHKYVPELMLLVASAEEVAQTSKRTTELEKLDADAPSQSVSVSLLMFQLPIQYRIRDIGLYLYEYEDPGKVLEEVAYEFLSEFAARVTVDDLLGPARTEFNEQFQRELQQRLDELNCGIEIIFAGTANLHPPAEEQVAKTYLSAISAETKKGATIHAARGEARRILTRVAGTEEQALALDAVLQELQALEASDNPDPVRLAELSADVDAMMIGDPLRGISPLNGQAAAAIAEAQAAATEQVVEAQSKARMFGAQLAGYRSAPELYVARKQLEIFSALDWMRKFLILGDADNVIVSYDTAEKAGLDQILTTEEGGGSQ